MCSSIYFFYTLPVLVSSLVYGDFFINGAYNNSVGKSYRKRFK